MKTNVCYQGDCLDVLKTLPENSVDSIVTDPPYHLASIVKRFGKEGSAPAKFGTDGAFKRASTGFMGKTWDGGDIAFNPDMWKECLRVLKPGGHLLSFSGTRTYHRMAVAIEDAGFEVRDMIEWVYGSGFPKSLNIGKAVDKFQGNKRKSLGITKGVGNNNTESMNSGVSKSSEFNHEYELTKGTSEWEGWGTALKPAHEPICMARKPLAEKTVAQNVLKYGTGGINIDESRVEGKLEGDPNRFAKTDGGWGVAEFHEAPVVRNEGRFPANLIHDNSEEVRECFPNESERFFKSIIYQAKASKSERNKGCEGLEEKVSGHRSNFRCQLCGYQKASGTPCKCENPVWDEIPLKPQSNNHPTVKPIALCEYLIKMITPKGGIVLDPFAGSGSTLVAAKENSFQYIGIEMTEEYLPIIQARTGCEIINLTDKLPDYKPSRFKEKKTFSIQKEVNKLVKDKCPKCGGKIKGKYCEDCLEEYNK